MAREMKNSGIEWIGEIPAEWNICHFRNIANIFNGNSIKDAEKANYEDSTDAVPYIATKDVDAIFQTIDYDNGMYVKKNDNNFKRAPKNSVLLCIEGGSAGKKIAFTNQEVCFINKLCCFYTESVVNRFLFYYMLSPAFTEEFKIHISGLIGGVSISEIKGFSFVIPSMKEQNSIVAFLDRKCAEIDAVIEKTKATIEEYKKLKQSIITEAVTKGIRGDRPMKDSGIEWIGEIPADWDVVRIKTLFDYRNEKNFKPLEQVNLISLYADLGVVQHCDLEATTGNKASNADGYKLVFKDDIVVNIILCWMGAIGRSAYNGVTSPAYDVYSPKKGVNSKFYHYLFRTQGFSGDCYKVGRGIMAMRWRTYSEQFRAIKVIVPPQNEQDKIIQYLDKKCAEIDSLIAKKTNLLNELENYKKSLIYEYVTGKKECSEIIKDTSVNTCPRFPAVINASSPRFAQAVLMSKILDECRKNTGSVKLEKMLFTIEYYIGFEFDTEYVREVAGPLDTSFYDCKKIICKRKWYIINEKTNPVLYRANKNKNKYKKYYDRYFAKYDAEINRIIDIFKPYSTDQAEKVATLFAAWNDAIIDGKNFSDEDIVNDVLNNWNDSKKRFSKDVWLCELEKMRKNNLIPKGYGKKTVIKGKTV